MNILPDPVALADKVKQLATDQPERETGNEYVDRIGRPECIVGQAMHELGVPVTTLRSFGSFRVATLYGDQFGRDPDMYTPEQAQSIVWVHKVQLHQDQGSTWGQAVNR